MSNYSVYVLVSPEGKRYVGMTMRKPEYRWNHGKAYDYNRPLFDDINKFGWGQFEKIIVKNNLNKEEACLLERKLIKDYKTQNPNRGYNVEMGGVPTKLAEQTKQKMSVSHIGIERSEEWCRHISESKKGNKNGMFGRTGKQNPTSRKVNAYIDDELVFTFMSIADACRSLNLSRNSFKNISACCMKKRKTAYGYVWRYADD